MTNSYAITKEIGYRNIFGLLVITRNHYVSPVDGKAGRTGGAKARRSSTNGEGGRHHIIVSYILYCTSHIIHDDVLRN